MNVPKKQLASEVLIDLHRRLSVLPSRSHERRMIMQETAHLYGISEQTLYRALAQRARPKALRRSDRGTPRVVPQEKMGSGEQPGTKCLGNSPNGIHPVGYGVIGLAYRGR